MKRNINNKMDLYEFVDKKQRHYIRWLPLYKIWNCIKEAFDEEYTH